MAAMNYSLLLGILGNILSILVFTSPMKTFWRIYKRRSTENFKALPYICTLLSTSLWSYYGLIKPGGTLILTINAAGTVLQSFYLIVFLIFVPKQRKARTALLAFLLDGLCFGLIFIATFISTKGSQRVFVVGAICSAISVSMYASPLVALRSVIRTKSVEFMPFFLSLFLFLNGGVWALYALLVKDVFIGIPNVIGFVLGGVQLTLYVYYKNFGKTLKKSTQEKTSFNGENTSIDDLEMGRSVSLPKQIMPSNKQTSPTTILKHRSLPTKIMKTSSSTLVELMNFLQEKDPIATRPKHENETIQDQAFVRKETQRSPSLSK
ncbi:hypothetical protein GOP47_0023984 [Adiantum capillus-veneris]|uniref:Bidirectional sugar transporter SWEET n=1 Tax=Adiantum capillus-veneris TaxID=13818 RepID=A0A9D4Z4Z4_ADICA|nr:hypothetical protein GOP47_0023984 [Adiantum capillus-veneris]